MKDTAARGIRATQGTFSSFLCVLNKHWSGHMITIFGSNMTAAT